MALLKEKIPTKLELITTKVTKSGNYYEVRHYERPYVRGYTVDRAVPLRKPSSERRSDNISRARNTLIRRVLANSTRNKPLFLTLTYASNMQDRDKAVSDFARFVRSVRRLYGKLDYVYVLETQARGAWHIHVLVFNRDYMRIEPLRLLWQMNIQEDARVNIKSTNDSKHVAFYISKYLGKDASLTYKRAYSASRGLASPIEHCYPHHRKNYTLPVFGECIYSGGYFTELGGFVNIDIYYENESVLHGLRGKGIH